MGACVGAPDFSFDRAMPGIGIGNKLTARTNERLEQRSRETGTISMSLYIDSEISLACENK